MNDDVVDIGEFRGGNEVCAAYDLDIVSNRG